jgi:hypothetical protein
MAEEKADGLDIVDAVVSHVGAIQKRKARCRCEPACDAESINKEMVKHAEQRGGKVQEEAACVLLKARHYCELGHMFYQKLAETRAGKWCYACARWKMEGRIRKEFENYCGVEFPKRRPDFLKGQELDGYNAEMALAFEFQGVQHEKVSPGVVPEDDEEKLAARQAADDRKRDLCKENGIELIEVWYHECGKGRDLRILVRKKLESVGITGL